MKSQTHRQTPTHRGRTSQFDGEVDLVVLNDASPVLRFEAISGRRIFCRDQERFADFFSLTAREYEEAMAYLARGLRYRREARQSAKH